MPWRGHYALFCKVCGKHRDDVGPMSARYKCADCGEGRAKENARQLKAHSGPHFQAWRRGIVESLVGKLVSELTEEERRRYDQFLAHSRALESGDVRKA